MQRAIDILYKFRWVWVAIIFVITAFLAPYAASVKPDNSIETMAVQGDPAISDLRELARSFKSDEFISISFTHDDILSAAH